MDQLLATSWCRFPVRKRLRDVSLIYSFMRRNHKVQESLISSPGESRWPICREANAAALVWISQRLFAQFSLLLFCHFSQLFQSEYPPPKKKPQQKQNKQLARLRLKVVSLEEHFHIAPWKSPLDHLTCAPSLHERSPPPCQNSSPSTHISFWVRGQSLREANVASGAFNHHDSRTLGDIFLNVKQQARPLADLMHRLQAWTLCTFPLSALAEIPFCCKQPINYRRMIPRIFFRRVFIGVFLLSNCEHDVRWCKEITKYDAKKSQVPIYLSGKRKGEKS